MVFCVIALRKKMGNKILNRHIFYSRFASSASGLGQAFFLSFLSVGFAGLARISQPRIFSFVRSVLGSFRLVCSVSGLWSVSFEGKMIIFDGLKCLDMEVEQVRSPRSFVRNDLAGGSLCMGERGFSRIG